MKRKPIRAAKTTSKAAGNGARPPKPRLLPFEDLIERIFKVDRTVGVFTRR